MFLLKCTVYVKSFSRSPNFLIVGRRSKFILFGRKIFLESDEQRKQSATVHIHNSQSAFTFSKLTIKTPERRHWRRSNVFIVNFEHISQCSRVSIVNSEQVNADWVT